MFLNGKSLTVVALRGFTLFAKLVFTIVLARLLPLEEFGRWILVVAIVNYGIFIVGAEIYNLTLRSYISDGYAAVIPKFSAQWSYFGVAYLLIVVVGAVLSQISQGELLANAFIIALILVLEHFTQELHRLAIFRDQQVHANAILLIKTAGWMIPTGAYLAFAKVDANLYLVLKAWLAGAAVAALYAIAVYREIFHGLRPRYVRHFSGRLNRAFGLLAPFVILAIAVRTPMMLDRYLIERFAGAAALGPYGYYATFGNGVQSIFEAVVLARLIPRLLREKNDHAQNVQTILSFMRQSAVFWAISFAGLYVAIPYVNQFVGKESFQDSFGLLVVLFAGQMIFSLSIIVQYGLYALHRDRQLTVGALLYMGLSLIFYFALIPPFGTYGAAVALAIAAAGLLALRLYQLLGDKTVASPA